MVDELPNHIEEYFQTKVSKSEFLELLESDMNNVEAQDNNISLRTELNEKQISLLNFCMLKSEYLSKKGLKNNVYSRAANQFQRLMTSYNRASRKEFVDINKRERFDENAQKFSTLKNLTEVKQ